MNKLDVTTRHLTLEALLWEGFFPELNRLALAHEPVILVIHNNGYVGEKPLPLVFANPCLVDLAPAFRIRGARIRAEALAPTLERARQVCETGHGPFLIELLEETTHS